MPASSHHETWSLSYRQRASLPNTSALTAYLLHLVAFKRTNLCLSADVTTTSELLAVAEEVGNSICILKTHCDIISDFGERTIRGLRSIARRKHFLIFEDRKFADIGETVRKQYTGGPFRIASWSEITNAHILPGPAIISGLKEGARNAIAAHHAAVHTEISADPQLDGSNVDSDEESISTAGLPPPLSPRTNSTSSNDRLDADASGRKLSIVSISTTISTRTESINRNPPPEENALNALASLGEAPVERSLLLLAEMSSKGHLLTGAYTEACVTLARENRDFVMGFIAQQSLNTQPGDNFLTMTPGCQLPPESDASRTNGTGDNLGQQYNTPRKIIYEQGCDIVIVGRGIVQAEHRALEAERYRREAWAAYEERIAGRS